MFEVILLDIRSFAFSNMRIIEDVFFIPQTFSLLKMRMKSIKTEIIEEVVFSAVFIIVFNSMLKTLYSICECH